MVRLIEMVGEKPERMQGNTIYVVRTTVDEKWIYIQAYSNVEFKGMIRKPVEESFHVQAGLYLSNERSSIGEPVYEDHEAFLDSIIELNRCEVREGSLAH